MSKISELPTAAPLDGAEFIPVVQDGQTRKTEIGNLQDTAAPAFLATIWQHVSGEDAPLWVTAIDFIGESGGC